MIWFGDVYKSVMWWLLLLQWSWWMETIASGSLPNGLSYRGRSSSSTIGRALWPWEHWSLRYNTVSQSFFGCLWYLWDDLRVFFLHWRFTLSWLSVSCPLQVQPGWCPEVCGHRERGRRGLALTCCISTTRTDPLLTDPPPSLRHLVTLLLLPTVPQQTEALLASVKHSP